MKRSLLHFSIIALALVIAGCSQQDELPVGIDGCKGMRVNGHSPFGGPYAIGGTAGPYLKEALAKVAEFEAFKRTGWNLSEVTCLDKNLFTSSVQRNKATGFPFSDKYQRYNYVIIVDSNNTDPPKNQVATIHVAKWRLSDSPQESGSPPFLTFPCTGVGSQSDSRYGSAKIPHEAMVNFFPEVTELPDYLGGFPGVFTSPCSVTLERTTVASLFALGLNIGDTKKERGALDAHGKHFMLRQLPGTRLANFNITHIPIDLNEIDNHPWVKNATVAYAGEIIVNLSKCTYLINQGSGTYRPEPGDNLSNLQEVARVFQAVLGSPPSHVVFDSPPNQPTIGLVKGSQDTKLVCPYAESSTQ